MCKSFVLRLVVARNRLFKEIDDKGREKERAMES